jgi:Ribosomal protein S2
MKLNKTVNIKLNSQDLTFFVKKNSILSNLQVLKAKVYEKRLEYKNSFFEIEEKFIQLKIALTVIYSYHFSGKTILFVGVPNKLVNFLIKMRSSHIFLPSNVWSRGIFINKNFTRKHLKYQKLKNTQKKSAINKINKLLGIIKVPKLIVILDSSVNYKIINEIYKLRLPIITLNCTKTITEKFLYTVFESLSPTKITGINLNIIFLNLLSSLFLKNYYFLRRFETKICFKYKLKNKKPLENNLKKTKMWKNSVFQTFKHK